MRQTTQRETTDIREYIRIILVHKWIILFAFLSVIGSTLFWLHRTVPIYEAKTVLMREVVPSPTLSLLELSPRTPSPTSVENQRLMITSGLVLNDVIQKLKGFGIETDLEELRRRIKVEIPRNTQGIEIKARATDPKKAAIIANTVANTYIEKLTQLKTTSVDDALSFLNFQMQTVERKLRKTEEELTRFKEKEGLFETVTSQGREVSSGLLNKLGELQSQLSKAQLDEELAMAELESLRKRIEDKRRMISGSELSTSQIEILQKKITEWKVQLAILKEKYTETAPAVVAMENQINEAERQLQNEFRNLIAEGANLNPVAEWQSLIQQLADLKVRVDGLKRRRALLERKIADFRKSHPEIASKEVQLSKLERESRIYEQAYIQLMDKRSELELMKRMKDPGVSIVEHASPPDQPISPKTKLSLMLGAVVGLALGLGTAFFLEYIDNTIKRDEDVERYLDLPLVGIIPKIPMADLRNPISNAQNPTPEEKRRRRYSRRHEKRLKELLGKIIIYHQNSREPFIEGYRTIQANIRFAKADKRIKSVLLTSPGPGEGKTVTAANLAITCAQSGIKTLIVDLDMRRPRLHRIFSTEREGGVSELLAGDELETNIRETEVEELYLLTSGAKPPNPTRLLQSERLRDLIERLKSDFDLLIFDTPPILSVSDPLIISRYADITLLVVEAGKTKRELAREAAERLKGVGADIFGVILNNVNYSKHYGSYYYYYRHYYYYYKSDEE